MRLVVVDNSFRGVVRERKGKQDDDVVVVGWRSRMRVDVLRMHAGS